MKDGVEPRSKVERFINLSLFFEENFNLVLTIINFSLRDHNIIFSLKICIVPNISISIEHQLSKFSMEVFWLSDNVLFESNRFQFHKLPHQLNFNALNFSEFILVDTSAYLVFNERKYRFRQFVIKIFITIYGISLLQAQSNSFVIAVIIEILKQ